MGRWYDTWQQQEMSLFSDVYGPALGLRDPPNEWLPGNPFKMVKRVEYELDHSLPPGTMVKDEWSYSSTSAYAYKHARTETTSSFIFQCADVNWIQSTHTTAQLQIFCEYSDEHLGCMISGFCCDVNDISTLLGCYET